MTNYTWYKDDDEEEPGSSLKLGAVDPSHSGLYRCKARNDLGEDQSAAIQLDIQCELIFHSKDFELQTTRVYVSSGFMC